MASISHDKKNGTRRIQFIAPDGGRSAIRLGKVSHRAAEAIKYRVEVLLASKLTGHPIEADTANWIANLEPAMADKLARVGLIPKRDTQVAMTLGPFLTAYIEGRTDVKPLTTRHLNDARRNLVEYFGENKRMSEITPGDTDDFRLNLRKRLGENTVRRQCGRAKQFLRAALRKRLINENPFADMKGCGVQSNRSRDYFLTRDDAAKVLEACPDSQWRLIFALSRFGGLRCPSEHLALRWSDVDWAANRIRIPSPKTEHHDGGESRLIPLFPELRRHLEQVWDEAEPGTEYVITRYRSANTNLRTQFQKIIRRAGLEPWPKLFHNLRATRETELAESNPMHVVCQWIGNSAAVAAKHYLQVTDAHFEAAAQGKTEAAQNPAQSAHAGRRNEPQSDCPAQEQTPVLQGFASDCDNMQSCLVPRLGLEPRTY